MSIYDTAKTIPIIQVYEQYTGRKVEKGGRNNVACPFHKDTNPSMRLYPKNNTFFCFSCKAGGSVIDLVQKIKRLASPEDAAKDICDTFNLHYENVMSQPKNAEYESYVKIYEKIAKLCFYSLPTAKCNNPQYFARRGLSSVVQSHALGYCPRGVKLEYEGPFNLEQIGVINHRGTLQMEGRFVFPIKDANGRIVGFGGRSTDPNAPKYLNTPETKYFKKRSLLYNYDQAKKYPTIIIVEGFTDALSVVSAGINNVVAMMGTTLTPEHLALLKGKHLLLALDTDDAGQERTFNIIMEHPEIHFRVLDGLKQKDLNECLVSAGPKELIKTLHQNIPGIEFVIKYLIKTLNLNDLTSREKLWQQISMLLGAKNEQYRQKYPLNLTYSPVAFDYYWKMVTEIVEKENDKQVKEEHKL